MTRKLRGRSSSRSSSSPSPAPPAPTTCSHTQASRPLSSTYKGKEIKEEDWVDESLTEEDNNDDDDDESMKYQAPYEAMHG